MIIPGPADHLAVFAKHRVAERDELDPFKSLRAAALALRAPRLLDHLASSISGDQCNRPGPPREHLACHFLRHRFLCRIVRPNVPFAHDTCTVCRLVRQFHIEHLFGQNCSSRLMRAITRVGSVEITKGSTWIQTRVQSVGRRGWRNCGLLSHRRHGGEIWLSHSKPQMSNFPCWIRQRASARTAQSYCERRSEPDRSRNGYQACA